MKLAEQRAEQALPELRDWLNRLLALTDEMAYGVKYSDEDHLSFMALCFLGKQVDHARSVILLIPSRDAVLVARSMIEGLVQLLWAESHPDVLPLKWREFRMFTTGVFCERGQGRVRRLMKIVAPALKKRYANLASSF